jgi:hypothetical protein
VLWPVLNLVRLAAVLGRLAAGALLQPVATLAAGGQPAAALPRRRRDRFVQGRRPLRAQHQGAAPALLGVRPSQRSMLRLLRPLIPACTRVVVPAAGRMELTAKAPTGLSTCLWMLHLLR